MNASVLTAAGAALAATALSATASFAAPTLAADRGLPIDSRRAAAAGPAPSRAAVARLQDAGISYTQLGGTVTVRQDGRVRATVTLRSVSRSGSHGRLVLDVASGQRFVLHARNFVWEDQQGGENAPLRPGRVLYVNGGTKRVTLDYRQVSGGAVVWIPGSDVAGLWGTP